MNACVCVCVHECRLLGKLVVSLQHVVTAGKIHLREPITDGNHSLTDVRTHARAHTHTHTLKLEFTLYDIMFCLCRSMWNWTSGTIQLREQQEAGQDTTSLKLKKRKSKIKSTLTPAVVYCWNNIELYKRTSRVHFCLHLKLHVRCLFCVENSTTGLKKIHLFRLGLLVKQLGDFWFLVILLHFASLLYL